MNYPTLFIYTCGYHNNAGVGLRKCNGYENRCRLLLLFWVNTYLFCYKIPKMLSEYYMIYIITCLHTSELPRGDDNNYCDNDFITVRESVSE